MLLHRQSNRHALTLISSTLVAVLMCSLFALSLDIKKVSAACVPSVYVAYSAISAYDTTTQNVIDLNGATAGTSVGIGGHTNYDMVATPDGSKIYGGSFAGIYVLNTSTNVVTRISTSGTIWAIAINSTGTTAYATNNTNNRIDVIDTATDTITGSIALGAPPSAMAIKPDDSQLWVRFNYNNGIGIVDLASQTLLDADTNTAGTQFFFAGATNSFVNTGQGIDFNPSGTRAVASNFASGTISFINTVTMQLVDVNGATAGLNTPTVGSSTIRRVKYSPDGLRIFALQTSPVSNVRAYTADFSSYAETSAIQYPQDIAFLPNGKFAVANYGGSLHFFDSSGSDSAWGGSYTQTADVPFSSAHSIEYGCATSLISNTTSTTSSSTTSPTTSSTTSSSTTSSTSSSTTSSTTTAAPQSTTSTIPTAATVPLSTTTTLRSSTSSTSTSTSTSTSLPATTSSMQSTTTSQAPTTTVSATQAVEDFVGVSTNEVEEIAGEADTEKGGALFIGGRAVEVKTETTLSSFTLSYLNAAVKLQCYDKDGKEINLSADSRFEVRRGDTVRVTIVGFKPGSEVRVAVFSTPTALGAITADINGDGIQQWKVPDSLSAGKHTLITTGDLAEVKDAVFGLRVIIDDPSFVARVASSTATRVILALGVLFGLLIPATRRRRRDTELA